MLKYLIYTRENFTIDMWYFHQIISDWITWFWWRIWNSISCKNFMSTKEKKNSNSTRGVDFNCFQNWITSDREGNFCYGNSRENFFCAEHSKHSQHSMTQIFHLHKAKFYWNKKISSSWVVRLSKQQEKTRTGGKNRKIRRLMSRKERKIVKMKNHHRHVVRVIFLRAAKLTLKKYLIEMSLRTEREKLLSR